MRETKHLGLILAGLGAGAVNGLFGAGGGMVLVPLLTLLTPLDDSQIFPASISIILPICLVSLTVTAFTEGIAWGQALPYLIGSGIGGIAAGLWGKKIPVKWLHRGLGILILWGGYRYLC
ncbi:MAG: TSUP family transporter [Oscillospiraceae bacterium]|nr:TSUP family transporter [Oscillospiraceae bacterium]